NRQNSEQAFEELHPHFSHPFCCIRQCRMVWLKLVLRSSPYRWNGDGKVDLAARDKAASTSLRLATSLNVSSSTLPCAGVRAPGIHSLLAHFATNGYER